jgi:hypothetical protein
LLLLLNLRSYLLELEYHTSQKGFLIGTHEVASIRLYA